MGKGPWGPLSCRLAEDRWVEVVGRRGLGRAMQVWWWWQGSSGRQGVQGDRWRAYKSLGTSPFLELESQIGF